MVGDDRPYNVALIVLDPDFAPVFAQQKGIEGASLEELAPEGVDLASDPIGCKRRLGIVPQDSFLFAESIYDKVKDGEKIFASTKAEVGIAVCA